MRTWRKTWPGRKNAPDTPGYSICGSEKFFIWKVFFFLGLQTIFLDTWNTGPGQTGIFFGLVLCGIGPLGRPQLWMSFFDAKWVEVETFCFIGQGIWMFRRKIVNYEAGKFYSPSMPDLHCAERSKNLMGWWSESEKMETFVGRWSSVKLYCDTLIRVSRFVSQLCSRLFTIAIYSKPLTKFWFASVLICLKVQYSFFFAFWVFFY